MDPTLKRRLWLVAKLAVSFVIIWEIVRRAGARDQIDVAMARLADLRWEWIFVSAAMLCVAIACSVVRWHRLLVGQGIVATWRHLLGAFMIGRFFGAVAPGGFTGLNGYRLYDIARHTGKVSRSTACIGLEMILGQLSLSVVGLVACLFGSNLGGPALGLIALVWLGVIGLSVLLISRPQLVWLVAARFPESVQTRVRSLLDAVTAYEGRPWLVVQAALLGVGTHAFNTLIYVSVATALGVELGIGELFFIHTMQIAATLLPVSVNGVGVRELVAAGIYTQFGLAAETGALVATLGFLVEMSISVLGGPLLLLRGSKYSPPIEVSDDARESRNWEAVVLASSADWPSPGRALRIGFSGGLIGGALVGLLDGAAVLATAGGSVDLDLWCFGVGGYGLLYGVGAGIGGMALATVGRWMKRPALPEAGVLAAWGGLAALTASLVIGVFRVRRDVFHEELVYRSPEGLAVLVGCAVAALLFGVVTFFLLRWLVSRSAFAWLRQPLGALGTCIGLVALATALQAGFRTTQEPGLSARATVPEEAGNVLFLVVDTLRADALPAYGNQAIQTPALDAFARDAVRFDSAFANASWTRPSFASMLTGRYAASHGVMSKASSLPDALVTLPEAFSGAGYFTGGLATNYNLAPFFNFQQGFDTYAYLAPAFVLGASDGASKLISLQVLRKVVERIRAMSGRTEPGTAYQDAETVNDALFAWLDDRAKGSRPWLMFAGYMDPHDPYYHHPYDGFGYGRAAHPNPDPSEASELRSLYHGEIEYWDTHFGKLIADLKKRGLYDDLTIVITSDHGEEFQEHGGFWHGTTLYDEQVHVPLFVKLPRAERAGSVERHWVQLVDLMPTLLERSGIDIPEGVQGGDLFEKRGIAFAEESHENNVLRALRVRRQGKALKIIEANAGNPRGLEPLELYALEADPGEQRNVARAQQALSKEVLSQLVQAAEQAQTGAVEATEVDVDLNQEAADRLEALGYFQ